MKLFTQIAAFLGFAFLACSTPVQAQTPPPTGPNLIKSSITVRADRLQRLWKSPTVSLGAYWNWMPSVSFSVLGPIPLGGQFSVDFTKANGTPWYSVECQTNKTDPGVVAYLTTNQASGHEDPRGTLDVGTFGFKIRYKNELADINQVMETGKFQVSKFHRGNALPAFKNQFEYVVSQDWMLPIGWLWFNPVNDPKVPYVMASMWFRGNADATRMAGYLFYKGKEICSTKTGGNVDSQFSLMTTGMDDRDPKWEKWDFSFATVRAYNLDTESANNWDSQFFLNKNPGDYEIKILRDGKLSRIGKFTVGADGAVVDNGLVAANKLGGIAMVLPVKVLDTEGVWDKDAYKTFAFYGNPLKGFVAP